MFWPDFHNSQLWDMSLAPSLEVHLLWCLAWFTSILGPMALIDKPGIEGTDGNEVMTQLFLRGRRCRKLRTVFQRVPDRPCFRDDGQLWRTRPPPQFLVHHTNPRQALPIGMLCIYLFPCEKLSWRPSFYPLGGLHESVFAELG